MNYIPKFQSGKKITSENSILASIYTKYPALKNLGDVTLKADSTFTREKTGKGSIEYFSPNGGDIRYDNGYIVKHPKLGTHGILYDPKTNDQQGIFLDMLHGMAASDPIYAKHRDEFGKAFFKYFEGDANRDFQSDMLRNRQEQRDVLIKEGKNTKDFDKLSPKEFVDQYTDGVEAWQKNWNDGNVRMLMFDGTDEEAAKQRYLTTADKAFYLSHPEINKTFNQLRNYIMTGKSYVLPEVEIKSSKKKFGEIVKAQKGNIIKSESTNTKALQEQALNKFIKASKSYYNYGQPSVQPTINNDTRLESTKKLDEEWFKNVNTPSPLNVFNYPLMMIAHPIEALSGNTKERVKEHNKVLYNPRLTNKEKEKYELNEVRNLGIDALINTGTAELGFVANGLAPLKAIPFFTAGSKSNLTADILQLTKTDFNKLSSGDWKEIGNVLLNSASSLTHLNNFDAQKIYSRLKNWPTISKKDKYDLLKDWANLGFAGGQQLQRTSSTENKLQFKKFGGNLVKRKSVGKKIKDQSSIPKTFLRKQEGMKIFEVDDNYIKINIYADFTEGGNGYAYPNFVPLNEIWVAKDKNKKNKEAIILHELAEVKKMKEGMSYNNAHEIANKKEMNWRRKFQLGGKFKIPKYQGGKKVSTTQTSMIVPSIKASTADNTTNLYNQNAEFKYNASVYQDQKEKDYQEAIKTFDDKKFREKYNTSPHKYKYDSDPIYKKQTDDNAKKVAKIYGELDLPESNMESKNYTGSYNLQFMNPNRLTGEAALANENYHMGIIGSVLPIPGLQSMGKIPSVFKIGKQIVNAPKIAEIAEVAAPLKSIIKSKDNFLSSPPSEIYLDVSKEYRLSPKQKDALNFENFTLTPKQLAQWDAKTAEFNPLFKNHPGYATAFNAEKELIRRNFVNARATTITRRPNGIINETKNFSHLNNEELGEKALTLRESKFPDRAIPAETELSRRFARISSTNLPSPPPIKNSLFPEALEESTYLSFKQPNSAVRIKTLSNLDDRITQLFSNQGISPNNLPDNFFKRFQRIGNKYGIKLNSTDVDSQIKQLNPNKKTNFLTSIYQNIFTKLSPVEKRYLQNPPTMGGKLARGLEEKSTQELLSLKNTGIDADMIQKEITKSKNTTGHYNYSGKNEVIHKLEDLSILTKTDELDKKIMYFRKAFDQLPPENLLRKKIEVGLADLESTKYLRTSFIKDLEERGITPDFKNMSIVTRDNTHFLVNEDGTLLGNITSSNFDAYTKASDVGASAVPPKFHGWTEIGLKNKPGEALYRGVSAGKKSIYGSGLTTSRQFAPTSHINLVGEIETRYRAEDFWKKLLDKGIAITRPDGRYEIVKTLIPSGMFMPAILNQFRENNKNSN